jgi:hypothetical protein
MLAPLGCGIQTGVFYFRLALFTAWFLLNLPATTRLISNNFSPHFFFLWLWWTGAGAVINSLNVRPGSKIAIFGCGAVGMSAIMAAKLVSCSQIVGTCKRFHSFFQVNEIYICALILLAFFSSLFVKFAPAIDLNLQRLGLARKLGATDTVQSVGKETPQEIVEVFFLPHYFYCCAFDEIIISST